MSTKIEQLITAVFEQAGAHAHAMLNKTEQIEPAERALVKAIRAVAAQAWDEGWVAGNADAGGEPQPEPSGL